MERRFDLLTRQIKTKFWATVWPYVRTDRVFGSRGRDMKIHFCPQNFAIWGTDRKFGTWPSSRARSTYYYYTTPGRTCQVFFETKIKKNPARTFSPRRCTHPRRNLPTWHRSRRTLRRGSSFYINKAVQAHPCSRDNPTR